MHGLRYNPPCKALFIVIVFFSLIFLVNAYFFKKNPLILYLFFIVLSHSHNMDHKSGVLTRLTRVFFLLKTNKRLDVYWVLITTFI
jgi:hypothetical protein